MNEQHWPAQEVIMLFNVLQLPMVRHLAHPQTLQPLCGAQGTWEKWGTPVDDFEPAAWRGCPACGRVLGWLIGEGDEVPPVLAALRQLLDDPTFGPQPLADYLLQHDGQVISEALALAPSYAPVTVWQDALVQGARGDHGTLIEAGICGHIFPPGETVVLVLTGSEGTALNLEALSALEAVKRVQAAGPRLSCVITRDLGPYWDRALFHLQPF
jgi:hypothetical protein